MTKAIAAARRGVCGHGPHALEACADGFYCPECDSGVCPDCTKLWKDDRPACRCNADQTEGHANGSVLQGR